MKQYELCFIRLTSLLLFHLHTVYLNPDLSLEIVMRT